MLQMYTVRGWPQNKVDLKPTVGGYWPIKHDLAINDWVTVKGKWVIIPFSLQKQTIYHLHSDQMGTEKTRVSCKALYWISMDGDTRVHWSGNVPMCLEYQWMQCQEKALHYKIPSGSWEILGADVFMVNGKTLLCILDYHSKLPSDEENKQPISRQSYFRQPS